MADHKIYIYAAGGIKQGGGDSAFTPFSNQDENSNFSSTFSKTVSQVENYAVNGYGSVVNGGIAALAKIAPQVAVVYLAVKVADKVTSTGANHLQEYTGDYRFAIEYNNFKVGIKNTLNLGGLMLDTAHKAFQFQKRNAEIQIQRTLVGNTTINDGKIGV